MTQHASYGEVGGPRAGDISRRSFMRRMLGVGVGLLSLEFLGGTLAFLWPNLTGGLGGKIEIGSAADINSQNPDWKNGVPYIYTKARLFLVNVPAAEALVQGNASANIADPGTKVPPDIEPAQRSVLALYRKCPHLGCQIPQLCDKSHWFECLCHGSKYTVLGEKRDGPAPRGMDRFDTLMQGNVYVVDTSTIITGPPIGTATFDNRGPGDMQLGTG
jgi:cytochrome b6-f complex iron-sulfur subunit